MQGVGFRPFVYRLAHELQVGGWVRNAGTQVELALFATAAEWARFWQRFWPELPPLARVEAIEEVEVGPIPPALAPAETAAKSAGATNGSGSHVAGGENAGSSDNGDRCGRGRSGSSWEREFIILPSREQPDGQLHLTPDVALCEACRRELFDPGDRRYLYPFINCTDCGPRYTIVASLPYDRPRTSMRRFRLCPECAREYADPLNRRFHAQPIACPQCGPTLTLLDTGGPEPLGRLDVHSSPDEREAFWQLVRQQLRAGHIVALKGLGGFHLACDATNGEAVRQLRQRKHRPDKPLAVMARDLTVVEQACYVREAERRLLTGPAAPIVLLQVREREEHHRTGQPAWPAWSVLIPGLNRVGVMLPYTPLHALLFDQELAWLVMTSGNMSGQPLASDNGQAWRMLGAVAHRFLVHNRPILRRLDDSVVIVRSAVEPRPPPALPPPQTQPLRRTQQPPQAQQLPRVQVWRRARGFVPEPLRLQGELGQWAMTKDGVVLAWGGELNGAFALALPREGLVYPGPHLGDWGTVENERYAGEQVTLFLQLLNRQPTAVAVDAHPGYHSSAFGRAWAERLGAARQGQTGTGGLDAREPGARLPIAVVQHQRAHVAAVMAEAGWSGQCVGLACDGTGWGDDGRIWGCEVFEVERLDGAWRRAVHLEYLPLVGGEAAIRQPWRIAAAYMSWLYPAGLAWLCQQLAGPRRVQREQEVERVAALAARARALTVVTQGQPVPGVWFTSSLGRLFDAVAALVGLVDSVSYEGQAAAELEALAERGGRSCAGERAWQSRPVTPPPAPATAGQPDVQIIRVGPIWRQLVRFLREGGNSAVAAAMFQEWVVDVLAGQIAQAAKRAGWRRVVLGGGCFQNQFLSSRLEERLVRLTGVQVAQASAIPPGDGGLAVGQALLALAQAQ